MDIYLCGLISACNWVAATIFLRFWRQTRDRLFLYFALAFVVFGFSRMPRAFLDPDSAWAIYPFLVRFIAYAFILAAIVDKNWQSDAAPRERETASVP
jgi:hypothetical protein